MRGAGGQISIKISRIIKTLRRSSVVKRAADICENPKAKLITFDRTGAQGKEGSVLFWNKHGFIESQSFYSYSTL